MKKLVSIVFLLWLFAGAGDVSACTCQDDPPSCTLFDNGDAVFVGKIENITSALNENIGGVSLENIGSISSWGANGLIAVSFKVEKALKGIDAETIKVITYRGTTCDLRVKKGQRWIIYAKKDKESGLLTFGACGGNRQIEQVDEDISFLDKYAKGAVKPLILGNLAKDFMPTNNSYDALVRVVGNGVGLSTQTRIGERIAGGSQFKFELPQGGKYQVTVSMPFSATFFPNFEPLVRFSPTETETIFSYEAEVSNNRCDYKNISVAPLDLKATAEINGQLINESGQLVSDHFIPNLCRVSDTEEKTLANCQHFGFYNDGKFSFDGLREGEFVIVLNPRNVPTLEEPFVRTYLPGTKDFTQARRIKLEQGAKVENLTFTRPELLRQTNVKGDLVLKNGKPVTEFITGSPSEGLTFNMYNGLTGADIYYFCQSQPNSYSCEIEPETVDPQGHFSFRGFVGHEYILEVRAENAKGKEVAGFVSFRAEENMKPLRLVLSSEGDKELEKRLQRIKQSK